MFKIDFLQHGFRKLPPETRIYVLLKLQRYETGFFNILP